MEMLNKYVNGNYEVEIYSDGTKIRTTDADEFVSAFPENIDVKITNYCDAGCAYCHEGSTTEGLHGNLNAAFFNTLRSGTELAIGGGNPLAHPDLESFLARMKAQGVICNLTVNQFHLSRMRPLLQNLIDKELVKGIGISFMKYDDELVEFMQSYPHTVLHVINGIVRYSELQKLFDKNLKVLILGYKVLRRGETFYSEAVENRKTEIYENIHEIIRSFDVVSFDNLGIRQLNVRRLFTSDEWETFYMGDDGLFTMYVDVVENEFALSSTSLVRHTLADNIDEMFAVVKDEAVVAA